MSEANNIHSKHASHYHYCGAKLNLGYNFTCHVYGDTYCYIHLSRHSGAHKPGFSSPRVHMEQAVLG